MRRHFVLGLFSFLFLVNNQIIAQISVGVKTGVHFGDARVEGFADSYIPELETYSGFTAGVNVEIPMLNGFSFRPEINYVEKGFRTMAEIGFSDIDIPVGAGIKTRLQYVEAPLLFKYSVGTEKAKFYAIAGPSFAYAADGFVRPVVRALIDFNLPRQDLNLSNDIYRRWDISATGGLGGEWKAGNGKIFADLRYTYGFANVLDNPIIDVRVKNQGASFAVGYAFNF
ncbi:MAG: PorT family protein [Saprospiraceae bacterium]|nr:PorT family protein [Saprospiraceae bacterium]MBK7525646.1 PorT family protein [Saprospiraceae bacterium]MBK8373188.1 PorT family protein [Saprospiraceae bacterium]MBK8548165.1 PorT family protein [Saprospiraceae bacterium]MBK8853969.1 PorT family protein [Saprospiraceae bacterium]